MNFKIRNLFGAIKNLKHPSINTLEVISKINNRQLEEKILQLINEDIDYIKDFSSNQHQRLHLAIIKLSVDEKFGFEYAKDLIYCDYRDLLMSADFGNDIYRHLYWAEEFTHGV